MNEKELSKELNNLCKSHKILQAAFLDQGGKLMALTKGFKLNSDDALTVAGALGAQYKGLIRLNIGKDSFVCQRNAENSLIGRNDTDFLCICKSKDIIVVTISDMATPGSSIFEMEKCIERIGKLAIKKSK